MATTSEFARLAKQLRAVGARMKVMFDTSAVRELSAAAKKIDVGMKTVFDTPAAVEFAVQVNELVKNGMPAVPRRVASMAPLNVLREPDYESIDREYDDADISEVRRLRIGFSPWDGRIGSRR